MRVGAEHAELLGLDAMLAYRRTLVSDRAALLDQFHVVDVARKVVGVGSVGTRCYVLLMQGVDGGDPLVLQFKEATASVLEPYTQPSEFDHHGARVVAGPAAHAGRLGHLHRLDLGHRRPQRGARLLRPAAARHEVLPGPVRPG